MLNDLKPRQEKFVQAYVSSGGNATKAAQTAGYGNGDSYSRLAGHRLITNDNIWNAVRQQSERMGLTPENILRRLENIIGKGKDSDAIQAIKVWADLTGSMAPKSYRFMDELSQMPKTPEEIDEMLERMRKTVRKIKAKT